MGPGSYLPRVTRYLPNHQQSQSAAALAAEIAAMRDRLNALERGPSLRYSSLEGVGLPVYDDDGQVRVVIGRQEDGTYTVVDHNAVPPPVPSAPVVGPMIGGLVITWDGQAASGAVWPSDFRCVEVHLGPAEGFIPTDLTQIQTISNVKGGQVVVSDLAPASVVWVTLVAVNTSSTESDPSAYASASPQAAVGQDDIDDLVGAVTEAQNLSELAQAAAEAAQNAAGDAAESAAGIHSITPIPILLPHSPEEGSISWPAFVIRYRGEEWPIAAGSTAMRWTTWHWNDGTPQLSHTLERPALTPGDMILFANLNGVPVRIFATNLVSGDLLVDGSITGDALSANIIQAQHLTAELAELTKLAVGEMTASYALFGSVTVQQITLGPDGFVVQHPNGTVSIIPADGTGPTMRGNFVAEGLSVLFEYDLRGAGTVTGPMTYAASVPNPAQAPVVTSFHQGQEFPNFGSNRLGLTTNPAGTAWVWADTVDFIGSSIQINGMTGSGVGFSSFGVLSGWLALGGITRVGDRYYVLAAERSGAAYTRTNWRVLIYDATGANTYQGSWAATGVVTGYGYPTIGTDGTLLLIGWAHTNGEAWVRQYTVAGAQSGNSTSIGVWGASNHMTSVNKTATGFSTTRFVVTRTDGIRVHATTGTRVPSEEWPAGRISIRGLMVHDGAWRSQHGDRVLFYTQNSGTHQFAYAWRDSDTGGDGVAETMPSRVLTTTPTKWATWRVSLPAAPPDDGTTDGANTAAVYASKAGQALVKQADLTEGNWQAVLTTVATTGATPKTSNEFSARGGQVGRWQSATGDVYADGNGHWSLAKGVNVDDTGWVNLSLASGYAVRETFTPVARHDGWRTWLRGKVAGTFPVNDVVQVATLPTGVPRPPAQVDFHLPGHSQNTSVRGFVSPNGTVWVVTGTNVPVYVSLDPIWFWTS